jgi:uncharacterized protein (DUF1501 family)
MMTRRVFLKNGSAALVSLGFTPVFIARAAQAAQARQKILIAIFQRGAVDGLNMVVPFGERAYYGSRPSIAVPTPGTNGGAVDLDGFFGLHPSMSSLAPWFKDGHLAIVHACGSPDDTRSHFDAQDYMESGTPGNKGTRDGWMNRYLHAKDHAERSTPFRAVALTQALPRSLQGSSPALAIGQLGQFGVRAGQDTDMMTNAFASQYAQAADAMLGATGREAFDAVKMLKDANPAGYAPANGAEYPRSGLWRRDAADRADHQGRSGPGSRIRRNSASGITTPTRAARPVRSPTAWTTLPPASRLSRATWATAWRMSCW